MNESIHERLGRVRKPRVQIKYQVETEGAVIEKELPFVVGVMGDFSGNPTGKKKPLKERKFVQIDRDKFDTVMAGIAPELNLKVTNTLEGGKDDIPVNLKFHSMQDFEPGRIIEQVPALKNLIDTRNKLRDLMTKTDRSDELENVLEEVLKSSDKIKQLSGEISSKAKGDKSP